MSNMPDVTKRQVSTRIEIETCRKVEKVFSRPGDKNKSLAFIRALEDATRDVQLDDGDYAAISAEIRQNKLKRGKMP